ncbi:unnamed protein product [Rhodiola kirilowii]
MVLCCVGSKTKNGSKDGKDLSESKSVPLTPRTEGEILQLSNMKSFCFNDLKVATRNFRPDSVVGEGGFGCVFKGWINERDLTAAKPGTGIVIAVKKLNQEGYQGHKEWLAKINYLGQLHHPNLVKLIGYAAEVRPPSIQSWIHHCFLHSPQPRHSSAHASRHQ